MNQALDRVARAVQAGDQQALRRELSALLSGPGRQVVMGALLARLDHPDPRVAATYALGAGALVEAGLPAEPLARALVAPLRRCLGGAVRFAEVLEAHEGAAEQEADDELIDTGVARLHSDALEQLTAEHEADALAFEALDVWYRPAAAAWTRATAVLAEVQARDHQLRALARRLRYGTQGGHMISVLLDVLVEAPLMVLVPELGRAYRLVADGIADAGQLSVLLSHALAPALAQLGASEPAEPEVLATMRGQGPQEGQGHYACSFNLYPWRAIEPESGLPHDGRFEWESPGGVGSISLPSDFALGAIEPIADHRVIALVGPRAPGGHRFTRVIGATRMFSGLAASLGEPTAVPYPEWLRRVLERLG